MYGIKSDPVPLDEQFQIRVADYAKPNGGIIFPNPNAPTGCVLALEAVEQILKASPDSVVVVFLTRSSASIRSGWPTARPTRKPARERDLERVWVTSRFG